MRVYHVARELERPNRAVLQLLRELGYTVPSHIARLAPEEETALREAVDRQQRGAPAVRAVHTAGPSIGASQVAEVVGKIDLEEEAEKRPGQAAASKTAPKPGVAAKPKKKEPATRQPRRGKEEVLEDLVREAEREGIEMVAEVLGPPLPPEGLQPEGVLRTVDLSAVEDTAVVPPQAKRRAVVNVGGRQVRTLQRRRQRGPKPPPVQASQDLTVPVPISIKEFSQIVGVKAPAMIQWMLQNGAESLPTMNTVLDEAMVKSLSEAFKRTVAVVTEQTAVERIEAGALEIEMAAEAGDRKPRPPVVTILGHVDHGKTSLLDKIRHTNVAAGEHGGITQHIGAFQVETESGARVTFLDTPGHAAFTAMRARGAQVADIVILVVAADDGVMPQTEEAILHAKQAKVPIVVAINKVDKSNANPMRVKQQLTAHGLSPEDWGGETIVAEVSAMTGQGVEELVESLSLQAEMEELTASPTSTASGTVLEARKDPHRGVICTLLVQDGTLHRGDALIAGMAVGRVRTMLDDRGQTLDEALPSTPIEVFGLDEVPEAGDRFDVVQNERLARAAVEERRKLLRDGTVRERPQVTLENLFSAAVAASQENGKKSLRIIIKADVRGSLEPLKAEIEKLDHAEVEVEVLYAGLGAVTQSDIDNAVAANAIVIGFHVLTESAARREAERAGVDVRHYTVIYEVIDDIRAAIENMLAPERREQITGHAEVRAVFASSKLGNIAGCFVIDGFIRRADYVRIYREGRLIYGVDRPVQIDSLRRIKDDVREVREGFECGIRISQYQDVKAGDVLEFYEMKEIRRTLESTRV